MESSGFESYIYGRRHYVLKNESYPDSYFEFPISNEMLSRLGSGLDNGYTR
jgi:D-alanyl-D-alanine dipeptidase